MKKSLVALASGTLGLGIAEYVMMGILPSVAADLNISITQAGHFISAYAMGVCVGAPLLVQARKFPLKNILLALASVIMVGNLGAALAPNYETLMLARFVSGLPHGAYFGVGSIIADKLADKGKSAGAIAVMVSGMTFANLLGVPLGTALSLHFSWRVVFVGIAVLCLFILYSIWAWIPSVGKAADSGLRGQFRFLKSPVPWLLIGATLLGNGGIFCWYSYINPLLTDVSGFLPSDIGALMLIAGLGMVAGNVLGGRLSDKFTPGRVAMTVEFIAATALLLLFFFASIPWISVLLMFICTTCLFAISSPMQLLLIRFSKGGELLGAASVQMAFNLGNAMGAYCGGLVLFNGLGYEYTALTGAPFAMLGFVALVFFCRKYEKTT